MKRSIKFRGRNTRGNWVVGSYLTGESEAAFIRTAHNTFEVDPDTIGQYTGMRDLCGMQLFEGDYIRADYRGLTTRGRVEWNNRRGAWVALLESTYRDGCKPTRVMLSELRETRIVPDPAESIADDDIPEIDMIRR